MKGTLSPFVLVNYEVGAILQLKPGTESLRSSLGFYSTRKGELWWFETRMSDFHFFQNVTGASQVHLWISHLFLLMITNAFKSREEGQMWRVPFIFKVALETLSSERPQSCQRLIIYLDMWTFWQPVPKNYQNTPRFS